MAPVIGQAFLPGWSVRITPKPGVPFQSAPLAAAWKDPAAWAGTTYAGSIEMPAELVGLVALDELVVHGWDVARGAGLHDLEPLDPDDMARSREKMAAVGDTVRMAGIFGEPVPVPDDASEQDRYLAWTGRRP